MLDNVGTKDFRGGFEFEGIQDEGAAHFSSSILNDDDDDEHRAQASSNGNEVYLGRLSIGVCSIEV